MAAELILGLQRFGCCYEHWLPGRVAVIVQVQSADDDFVYGLFQNHARAPEEEDFSVS